LGDLEKTRDELQAMTVRIDVIAGEDISHLVEMYSTMKPKNAAAIFDRMDPAFAAGFLREIDSARAGVIMAEMGEEQSYRISLLIANRHAEWRNKG
jgi:flagellar motility protein MotE (MotC chaperone)